MKLVRHSSALQVGLHATLATLHPHSSRLAPDEDGLLPEWLVFNSLVATARNFLVKVSLECQGTGLRHADELACWRLVQRLQLVTSMRRQLAKHSRSYAGRAGSMTGVDSAPATNSSLWG